MEGDRSPVVLEQIADVSRLCLIFLTVCVNVDCIRINLEMWFSEGKFAECFSDLELIAPYITPIRSIENFKFLKSFEI